MDHSNSGVLVTLQTLVLMDLGMKTLKDIMKDIETLEGYCRVPWRPEYVEN